MRSEEPGWGLEVEPVEADVWGRTRGVRVSTVVTSSPADEEALEPGDRLLSANGRPLTGPLDFEGILLDLRAGDTLVVEVEGQRRPVRLEAEAFPSLTAERGARPPRHGADHGNASDPGGEGAEQ